MSRTYSAAPKTPALPDVEAFYDQSRKEYLVRDSRKQWTRLNETSLRRLLRAAGFDDRARPGEYASPMDAKLIACQTQNNVHFSGPVAGYHAGLHAVGDIRFLATSSPNILQADSSVEWPLLRAFIGGLLDEQQSLFLCLWLKCSLRSLASGLRTPGQALAIAGPRGCGKSLLQQIITILLGGRAARPYQFMAGATPFNAHLFGAEHLMVEDELPLSGMTARRQFGAQIKALCVNVDQSCHAKGGTPIMLRPFWRLTITLNDEPENLMVLPPMDESIADKIILLKAKQTALPMATNSPEQKAAFWAALMAELPGFVAHLQALEIPPELSCERYGVTHFHDPELLERLNDLAPESKLWTIIQEHLLENALFWEGRAEELEQALVDSVCPFHYEARRLLSWNNACGTYLGRLRRRYPDRITQTQKGDDRTRVWRLS